MSMADVSEGEPSILEHILAAFFGDPEGHRTWEHRSAGELLEDVHCGHLYE